MGGTCALCFKDYSHQDYTAEIEPVKKTRRRQALPGVIKIQAVWRGYIIRKHLANQTNKSLSVFSKRINQTSGEFDYGATKLE